MLSRLRHVGKSKDLKLKSVVTARAVALFVSRLHPSTVGSELRECVESVAGLSKIAVFGRPSVKRFALCYRSVVCPV